MALGFNSLAIIDVVLAAPRAGKSSGRLPPRSFDVGVVTIKTVVFLDFRQQFVPMMVKNQRMRS